MTKKTLIALSPAAAEAGWNVKAELPSVRLCRQHPSIRRGKSGVAAARRAAKRRRKVK